MYMIEIIHIVGETMQSPYVLIKKKGFLTSHNFNFFNNLLRPLAWEVKQDDPQGQSHNSKS